MTVGDRLKEERGRKRVRQDELAEKVGVSVKTIQRWESSEGTPNVDKMKLLANALGTTVAYLSGETDNPNLQQGIAGMPDQGQNLERPRISQATLDLEAMIKDLAYDYPDLAIGFRDTRKNWNSLSDNDKESIAEALMMVFKPELYVPKRLKREGRFSGQV